MSLDYDISWSLGGCSLLLVIGRLISPQFFTSSFALLWEEVPPPSLALNAMLGLFLTSDIKMKVTISQFQTEALSILLRPWSPSCASTMALIFVPRQDLDVNRMKEAREALSQPGTAAYPNPADS